MFADESRIMATPRLPPEGPSAKGQTPELRDRAVRRPSALGPVEVTRMSSTMARRALVGPRHCLARNLAVGGAYLSCRNESTRPRAGNVEDHGHVRISACCLSPLRCGQSHPARPAVRCAELRQMPRTSVRWAPGGARRAPLRRPCRAQRFAGAGGLKATWTANSP
jgi:hypothetical protein